MLQSHTNTHTLISLRITKVYLVVNWKEMDKELPLFYPDFYLPFPVNRQSKDIIVLAQSFPSLEGYVYSKTAVLGGLSLMKSYENTYPKSQHCAREKRNLKRRWTSISSVKPRLQSLESLKTALPATGSNNHAESAH